MRRQRHLVAPCHIHHPSLQQGGKCLIVLRLYCLEIQVTSNKDGGATPPPPHAWQVPVVEDML